MAFFKRLFEINREALGLLCSPVRASSLATGTGLVLGALRASPLLRAAGCGILTSRVGCCKVRPPNKNLFHFDVGSPLPSGRSQAFAPFLAAQ